MSVTPITHYLTPNQYCPNNKRPVLIYPSSLPLPPSEEKATEHLESHGWEKRGTWGHIGTRHFHPNTHECYGILKGESTLLLGCGAHDDAEKSGLQVDVQAGDVIVLPAGTGHCSLQSSKDYRYIGVYPKGCPRWRNEWGKEEADIASLRQEADEVPNPVEDPVVGGEGPLLELWS